ncbi:MAG: ZIP family metal transporter [Candidatus Woesearchaeota archaeon]
MFVIATLVSVFIISILSILVALPFLLKKEVSQKTLLLLLSFSVGVLLSAVFFSLLPESFKHAHGNSLLVGLMAIAGFVVMFIVEKFVHYHHNSRKEKKAVGHSHAYHLAPMNIIGDGVHNFIDGLVIAASYAASLPVGIATTVSVLFHELPQELADMGVLLYAGLSKKRAILFNFISASTAIIGALLGILLAGKVQGFTTIMLPFAAGNFLYIAAVNLVPQLHRHCSLKEAFKHIFMMLLGVALLVVILQFAPMHVHG